MLLYPPGIGDSTGAGDSIGRGEGEPAHLQAQYTRWQCGAGWRGGSGGSLAYLSCTDSSRGSGREVTARVLIVRSILRIAVFLIFVECGWEVFVCGRCLQVVGGACMW